MDFEFQKALIWNISRPFFQRQIRTVILFSVQGEWFKFYIMLKNNQVLNLDSEHFQTRILPPISSDLLDARMEAKSGSEKQKYPNFVISTGCHSEETQKKKEEQSKGEKRQTLVNRDIIKSIKKKKKRRVNQSWFWYIFTIVSTILLGTQNLYIYLWNYDGRNLILLFPSLLLRIPLFICGTRHLTDNVRVIRKLYLCFDKVFLTTVALCIGAVGFFIVYKEISTYPWVQIVLCVLYPISVFLQAGYYRIVLVHVNWSKTKTIIMKIALLIGGASYFGLGLYYTISQANFTDGQNPDLQKKIRNYLFLFAFAGFDFYLQSFALMDDIDGSTHCKSIYRLQCPHENMEILLKATAKREKQNGKEEKREYPNDLKIKKAQSFLEQIRKK